MRNRRLARRLLCLLFLFCQGPGCQTFHRGQELTVLVRDAETKAPVATAEVYLCQRLKQGEVAPCRSMGLTQADGIARLRAEPASEYGFQVQAVAPGYLPEKIDMAADALKKNAGGPPQQATEQRRADVIVEVYHEPDFCVELVLPPGYRGLIKAEVQIQDDLPLAKGQRRFCFPVSASGDVLVKGPAVLRRVAAPEFRARYGDGPLLGTAMDAKRVGFRWLKGAGNQYLFVVGNQLDYEALHRQVAPEETQAAFGAVDDPAWAGRSHKYRYGKITALNYESK
jgi:hypothetical protein